jgi:hypothetical protein
MYHVYLICKSEDIFLEKMIKLKSNRCDIKCYWIPAVYLNFNDDVIKSLNTRYNTKGKSILGKLGCIAAHRNTFLSIYNNKTTNNIILEQDATLENNIPDIPPERSCYLGGWIIPPQIIKADKEQVQLSSTIVGLNTIDYEKFKIITTHAYFVKTPEESLQILNTTFCETIKAYDIHLSDKRIFKEFYYPSIFYQSDHRSEIDSSNRKNTRRTINYGLI